MHDMGKLAIPDKILLKPGKLGVTRDFYQGSVL
jgi:response regulator RpfG family c-di-GMP phosphodiesterase